MTTISADDSIFTLDLSVRAMNCLKSAGITTIEQLISTPRLAIKRIRNLGSRSYDDIMLALERGGFVDMKCPACGRGYNIQKPRPSMEWPGE